MGKSLLVSCCCSSAAEVYRFSASILCFWPTVLSIVSKAFFLWLWQCLLEEVPVLPLDDRCQDLCLLEARIFGLKLE